ncbi:MAG: FliA/WhiG family RNA polymerase sigma factor [Opitutae bacterium]
MSNLASNLCPSEDRAKRFQQAAENYRHAMSNDRERDQWIENYLPLVKSIVNRLRYHFPENYETEDMYGIGVRSLILAVNRFDPSKGKSFGNYAALRIKGGLLDELRKIDHLPRANRAKAKSLQSTILELEQLLNRPPTPEEICKELKLSSAEYQKLLKETQPIVFVPLESKSPYSDSEDYSTSLSDTLHDPTESSAFDQVERKEKITMLRERIKELPEQSQKILMLYYIEELRLSEIAHVFNLSEGRISQILSHSIISLRAKFQTSE